MKNTFTVVTAISSFYKSSTVVAIVPCLPNDGSDHIRFRKVNDLDFMSYSGLISCYETYNSSAFYRECIFERCNKYFPYIYDNCVVKNYFYEIISFHDEVVLFFITFYYQR